MSEYRSIQQTPGIRCTITFRNSPLRPDEEGPTSGWSPSSRKRKPRTATFIFRCGRAGPHAAIRRPTTMKEVRWRSSSRGPCDPDQVRVAQKRALRPKLDPPCGRRQSRAATPRGPGRRYPHHPCPSRSLPPHIHSTCKFHLVSDSCIKTSYVVYPRANKQHFSEKYTTFVMR
jgi:hypothetical protein